MVELTAARDQRQLLVLAGREDLVEGRASGVVQAGPLDAVRAGQAVAVGHIDLIAGLQLLETAENAQSAAPVDVPVEQHVAPAADARAVLPPADRVGVL